MQDFKLFAICPRCKKRRLFISKHTVKLPIGLNAVSKDLFCSVCNGALVRQLKAQEKANG